MSKELILKGIAKYYRLGSKGTRHTLVIDDVELSEYTLAQLSTNHGEVDIKGYESVQKLIRNKRVEVRLT